jgi:hypothetical protein
MLFDSELPELLDRGRERLQPQAHHPLADRRRGTPLTAALSVLTMAGDTPAGAKATPHGEVVTRHGLAHWR